MQSPSLLCRARVSFSCKFQASTANDREIARAALLIIIRQKGNGLGAARLLWVGGTMHVRLASALWSGGLGELCDIQLTQVERVERVGLAEFDNLEADRSDVLAPRIGSEVTTRARGGRNLGTRLRDDR
eukprot:7390922-Prymnesium_polylepis.1